MSVRGVTVLRFWLVQQVKANFAVCVSAHVCRITSNGFGCTINRPTEEQHYDNCPLFSCHGNANGIHQRKPGFKKQSILKRGERTLVLQEREQLVHPACQM